MLPDALMYGMTPHEFWHEDVRLLTAYRKAFFRKAKYLAWLNGAFGKTGTELALAGAFSKNGKVVPYINYSDIDFEEKEKPIVTKDNLEGEFRKEQVEQQSWLRDLMNKG